MAITRTDVPPVPLAAPRPRALFLLAVLAASAGCRGGTPDRELETEPAQLPLSIAATCAGAIGDVQIRRAGEDGWERAAVGAVLRAGDEVQTGRLSTARLAVLAGGALELEESSVVMVGLAPSPGAQGSGGPPAVAGGEGRVRVKRGVARALLARADGLGSAVGLVVLSADGSELRLAARAGPEPAVVRLGIHGTATELAVLQGAATVRGARGESSLAAGRVADARDGVLAEPAALVAPPQALEPGTDARLHFVPELAIRLRWKEVPGATAYRLQVARDAAFQDLEIDRVLGATEVVYRPVAAGVHAWRVAARDAAGRAGAFGPARRIRCEKEAPRDRLVAPADGAVVRSAGPSKVTFAWETAGGEAPSYLLVITRSPDLSAERVATAVVAGARAIVELPGPAEYWWGVYADPDSDSRPIFTTPRRVSVAEPPPARPARPRVETPAIEVPRSISQWGE